MSIAKRYTGFGQANSDFFSISVTTTFIIILVVAWALFCRGE